MTHKLIKTDKYLLVVDDSEIIGNGYRLDTQRMSIGIIDDDLFYNMRKDIFKKILAHLPFNGSPIIQGLDLLPPCSRYQEDGLEELSTEHCQSQAAIYPEKSPELTDDEIYRLRAIVKGYSYIGFKAGYNKAREKYKYTEDDVKEFLETFTDHAPLSYMKSELEKGLHKRIGTSQYPTEFECEMEYDCCKRYHNCIGCDATEDMINLRPKKITTAQGIQWVGKYK